MWWSAMVPLALGQPPHDTVDAEAPEITRVGPVIETFDGGGFTYALLDVEGQGRTWVAGPQIRLRSGQVIATTEGALMANFHSPTLDRTFDRIWFVTSIRVMGAAPQPVVVVDPTPAAGGLTVAEVHAQRQALADTEVTIRGQVVRFSPQILGRNWVHLQDGTGSADRGTHDLVITTDDTVAVGDRIEARGRVAIDQDLGSGYHYAVLVQGAVLSPIGGR